MQENHNSVFRDIRISAIMAEGQLVGLLERLRAGQATEQDAVSFLLEQGDRLALGLRDHRRMETIVCALAHKVEGADLQFPQHRIDAATAALGDGYDVRDALDMIEDGVWEDIAHARALIDAQAG